MKIKLGISHVICYAHTLNLVIQKILHSNQSNEKSNFREYDTESQSDDFEGSLETESDLSDISEEYSDYLRRNSEIEHFPDSINNIGDYTDLIKKVTKNIRRNKQEFNKKGIFR